MKIGFNTYEQRPQFKASFATTPGTKKALKALCEENHYRLYELNTALKKAEVKDIIEVSYVKDFLNKTKGYYIFKNTANNKSVNSRNLGFVDGISNLPFSNDRKIEDYEPAPLACKSSDIEFEHSRFEKELREEANTAEDHKTINEMYNTAFELEERYTKLLNDGAQMKELAEEKEKAYLMKELGLLD